MKKITLLLALFVTHLACFGQVSSYTFASSSGTYTPLSGGTALVPPGSGISGTGWSSQNFNIVLPFVFFYNGIGYSDVYVNSNGFLTFGKSALASNGRPSIVNDGQSGSICGFAASNGYGYTGSASGRIWLGTLLDFSNSNPIQYATIGSAPNRVFVVQWTDCEGANAYYPTSGGASESVTFQIRLSETTNTIDIVYNSSTTSFDRAGVTNGTTLYPLVGLCGASTADYILLTGTSFSSVTTSTSIPNSMIVFDPSNGITAGTTFTFTPPSGLQPSACSGTPSAPTAIATHGITCGTVPVGLGLLNLPLSSGLTYQWQSSATGVVGSWSNISGATNPSYSANPTTATHYQCLVACGSGTAVASSPVVVGYESSCPGMPSNTSNGAGSNPFAQIGLFSISGGSCSTTLSDATNSMSQFNYPVFGGTSGTQYSYLDMTSQPTHIKLLGSSSTTTTYTATLGNYGSTATFGIWMDINDDGVFTGTGEYIGSASGGGSAISATLTIPANAFGVHRMRVRTTTTAYTTSTIAPTGLLSGVGAANDYMVEIIPPTPTPTNSSPVCVTGALNLTSPSYTGGVYTWSGPSSYYATTSSATHVYTVPSTSAGGTYTLYTTVNGANACTGATTTVTVNAQPALSSASNNSPVCSGSTLNLTANSPTDVTGYAWVGPVAITSSGSASASVPGITPIGGGTYSVTVNNGTGAACTRTYITTATVNPLPSAISGPTQLCIGNTMTLGSSGTGTWSSSNSGVASVVSTTGVVSGVSAGTATITYTLTSTGCYVTSAVTVNAPPAGIGGGTSPFCPGSTTTLTNSTSGGTWSSGNTAMATVGSSTGIVTGVSGGSPVITYTLGTGCFSTATVTVINTPAITGGVGLCVGATSTLSNTISGGTWASSNPSVATIGSASGVVSGVSLGSTVITYTFPSTCTITATVNVTPAPSVYTVSGGGTTCSGGTGVHVLLSGSDAGVSYQMYTGVTPFGSPIFGTGGPLDFGVVTTGGTYSVVANPGTSCSANMTSSAVVSIYPSPNVFNVYGGGGYCTGGAGVHIYLSGSNPGINYQLYNGASTVGTPLSGSGTILDFGLLTPAGTYSVTATNAVTGCVSAMNGTATVTINPLPVAYSVTGTGGYCTGGTGVLVGLSGTDAGINYQLYRGGVAIGSVVAGTGGSISFGYQTVAGSYTVIATNTATGCTANMTGAANITINALPAIFSVTGGGTFCAGGVGVPVGLAGSATGVTYQLYLNGVSTGTPVAGTGTAISFGNKTAVGVYTVVATNASTCTNNMLGSATIIANPLPTGYTVTGGGNYCLGAEGEYVGLSGSDIGTSYFLYKDGTLVDGASGTSAALSFGLHTAAGFYTVSATIPGTGCSAVFPGGVTISIDPLPIAYTVTGGGSYCDGGTGFSIDLSSSQSGVNYVMNSTTTVSAMVAGTGSSITFGTYTDGGVYTVTAINSSTGCFSNMSGSATIVKNPLPTAYAVTGGGSYCAGGTGVNVGLGNSNTGISYQLLKDGLSSGAAVTGTGGAISFGPRTGAGTYTVEATNIGTGCINMMSGSVTIAINPLPTANNVTGGGNYCAGGSGVAVGLDNAESGVNYQLYRGTTPIGGTLPGTTGATINFGLQAIAGTYTVKAITALTGCTANMSGSATISVDPLPAIFTVTGGGNFCTGGSGVNVGLSNSVTGISYQLYNGASPIGAPMTGSGFALDFGMQTTTGTYTVIATDMTTGCTITMSGSAVVNTNTLPVVYAVTGGGNYCAGGTGVHVGLVSSEAGVNYQLYIGTSAAGSMISGTGAALDLGAQTIAGTYTVKATNAVTGCMSTMSGSAVVVMNALPAVQIVTGGGNYCIGGLGMHIGLTGSQTGVSYQLYNGSLLVGTGTPGTGVPLDFGYQTGVGTYTVTATNSLTGCSKNMSGTASIAISSMPTIYTVTGGGNYCPSAAGSAVGLSNSDIGVDYQLLESSTPVGSVVPGTGSALNFGLLPAGIYTVEATGTGTSCVGNMFGSATIAVHSLPIVHNVTGTGNYCAGGSGLAIGVDATETGVTYQLYFGGVTAGLPIAGTGSAIDFGLKTAAGVYTAIATNSITTCTVAMSGSGVITVDPLPTVYNVSGGGSYCAGGTGVHVLLNGSVTGIEYQLYNGIDPIGPAIPGTGGILDFGAQTLSGNYTVTASNPFTGCSKAMNGSATINILSLPTAFIVSGGGNFCAGGAGVNVTLSGSQAGVSYQLYRAGIFAIGSPLPGTGAALDFGLQTVAGSYTVSAVNTTTMCVNNMTGSTTVVPMTLPTVYTVAGSSAGYCIGGTGVTPILTNSEYGVSYQLFRGSTPIGTPLPGSGGPVSFLPQTTAGSYTVIGTNNASGCTSSMAGGASVTIYALPAIYTVTGGGSYCSGGAGVNVGLSGSDIGTNYQLIIGGAPGPIMAGTGSSLNFGLQTTGGYYTVKATNANGCVQNMTGSASVTISALPTALGVTGGGNYCSGSAGVPVGLSGSVMGISYRLYWGTTPIGSAILGTGSPINFGMQTLAGGYTVMATNTATGCTRLMTGSATVGVNTSPAAYAVAGGGGYCAGGTGVNIGIGGSASGVIYRLYRGTTLVTGPIAGTGAAIDFGMQTTAGTYSVTGTDAISGCVTNMGSTSVVVNANPVVYTVTGGGNYCAAGTGVLIGLSNSAMGVDYELSTGSSSVVTLSGTGSALDFGLQTTTGSYTVTATNASTGCSIAMAGSATVVANPVVVPAVTISTGVGDTVCSGVLTTFAAAPVNGGSSPTYQWTINGVPVGSAANSYSYLPLNGDVVGVQMTSSASCAMPAIATNSMAVTVNVPRIPAVSSSANPGNTVCQGSTVTLSAVPVFGGSAPAYMWMKNGIGTGVTTSTYTYTPNNGDNVYCIMYSNYRCRLQDSALSTAIVFTTTTPAVPVVTITADPGLTIAPGAALSLTASATNAGPAPTYLWKVNGITIPAAIGETYVNNTYRDQDQVTCEVRSSGACAGTLGSKTVTVRLHGVGVQEVGAANIDVKLLPNPNKGTFALKGSLGTAADGEVTIEITNMLGQAIYTGNAKSSQGMIDEHIQLSNTLANGMYILNLRAEGGTKVFHLVIEQ